MPLSQANPGNFRSFRKLPASGCFLKCLGYNCCTPIHAAFNQSLRNPFVLTRLSACHGHASHRSIMHYVKEGFLLSSYQPEFQQVPWQGSLKQTSAVLPLTQAFHVSQVMLPVPRIQPWFSTKGQAQGHPPSYGSSQGKGANVIHEPETNGSPFLLCSYYFDRHGSLAMKRPEQQSPFIPLVPLG